MSKDLPVSVMINRSVVGKLTMPPDTPDAERLARWAEYHRHFRPFHTTARGLAAEVYRGFAFCPVYTGRRLQTNFTEAWHIAFDLDTAGLEQVRALTWVDFFTSFAYSTPSSTPEAPRSRCVFIFDKPVTDPERYRTIYKAIAWRFTVDGFPTDPSCKDVLRLFFGSPRCALWPNWSVLGMATCDELIEQWREAIPAKNEFKAAPVKRPAAANQLPARFLEVASDKLLEHVRQAPDGQKHYTLRKIAYVFGGYVAGGYYDRDTAIEWLEQAIHPRARDKALASRTIRECLIAGMGEPLQFEDRERPAAQAQRGGLSAKGVADLRGIL